MKRFLQALLGLVLLACPRLVLAQAGREVYAEANAQAAGDDKRLNVAYEGLIKNIRASNDKDRAELIISSLRESQRAWLKFRDAQVVFVGTYTQIDSGSARAVGQAEYSHELTEERIKDFRTVPNPF